MIRLPNYDKLGRKKINKNCNVKRHQIIAIAFTKNGTVIAQETNRIGSGDVSDYSLHAEEFLSDKLERIAAFDRYGDIYMLVGRLAKAKGWTMAKPCDGCQRRMKRTALASVFYTEEDGEITEMKVRA